MSRSVYQPELTIYEVSTLSLALTTRIDTIEETIADLPKSSFMAIKYWRDEIEKAKALITRLENTPAVWLDEVAA